MAYRIEPTKEGSDIVIDGFEKGIASSPYTGIANMRNVGISYMPSVAYVNYKRQACTFSGGEWYAGTHSVNVSNNAGWIFASGSTAYMGNPVAKAQSPLGLNYILDSMGQVWKQTAVNSSAFTKIEDGAGRITNGAGGLAFWNNYLVVFGNGMIEFCGDGTGDAGINSSNWNLPGTNTTVQVTAPLSLFATSFTGELMSGATTGTLASTWSGVSGTYTAQFTTGTPTPDVRNIVFANGSASVSWSGGLSQNTTTPAQIEMYQLLVTPNTFVGYSQFQQGSYVTFSSTGTLPSGLVAGTEYTLNSTPDLTGGTIFTVSNPNSNPTEFIALNSAGSGTITMELVPSDVPPIQNTTITGFSWGTSGTGSTTIILTSPWLGATGIYNIVDPAGNNILGLFTYNSTIVGLVNPAIIQSPSSGIFLVQILNPSATTNKTWVSKTDGNLYFANGRWVGLIEVSPNPNINFNPGVPASYSFNYAVTGTLQPQDTVIDMTDLRGQMMILGNFDVYPWDYVSAQPSASSPVGEQGMGIINILNNVYIFAGQKGNIYVSNGAAAQLLYKIPDYISGVIDPVWTYGDKMFHRGKLYFQALAQDTSGNYLLAGVFSLNVSATLVTDIETAGAFNMEAQNSYGLVPSTGTTGAGLLIDNEPSSSGQDSYYSAYSTGSSSGGVDYNSTLLWGSNEPVIETDIIPIGNYLVKKTLGSIEFKLDRPLATGDSISLYWRPSLSASWTSIPTIDTSSGLLSNYAISAINQSQWAQFKITYSAASSSSSFIPLRELRLHLTP